jgi:hypothetical protein
VPDGRYRIVVSAPDSRAAAPVLLDRTLAAFSATPGSFSPNGDGRLDTTAFSFTLTAPAQVDVRVLRAGRLVSTLFSGELQPGPQQLGWNGTAAGKHVADGSYQAVIETKDTLATLKQNAQVVVDTRPPVLRLLSFTKLSFWVSEAATVTAGLDGQQVVEAVKRGAFRLAHSGPVKTLVVTAEDAAGNVSQPVHVP